MEQPTDSERGRSTKADLATRLALVRKEYFGEHGSPELARLLGMPLRTWLNYENGVIIPGDVLLRFIELTSVEPTWLLRGDGPRYRTSWQSEGDRHPALDPSFASDN
jgi:hypothetical protein